MLFALAARQLRTPEKGEDVRGMVEPSRYAAGLRVRRLESPTPGVVVAKAHLAPANFSRPSIAHTQNVAQ
jgi:hypothetical protein